MRRPLGTTRWPSRRRGARRWVVVAAAMVFACGKDEHLARLSSDAGIDGTTDAASEPTGPIWPAPSEAGVSGPAPIADASLRYDGGGDAGTLPAATLDGATTDGGSVPDARTPPRPDASEEPAPTAPTHIVGRVNVSPALTFDADRLFASASSNDGLDVLDEASDQSQPLTNPAQVGGYLGPLISSLGPVVAANVRAGAQGPQAAGLVDGGTTDGGGRDAGVVEPTDAGLGLAPDPWPGVGSVSRMDGVDYYRVRLERGQVVTLFIHSAPLPGGALAPLADLDLYLLDRSANDIREGGAWADDSLGSSNMEQVVAPLDGTYWIAVHRPADALSGNGDAAASRYTLLVNVPITPEAQEWVSANKLSTAFSSLEQRALVRRGDTTTAFELEELERSTETSDPRSTLRAIKHLRREPEVETAEPVLRFQPQGLPAPDDPDFARQWYNWPVDLLAGWVESERSERALGQDVVVAVVDTGIAWSHPDFINLDGSSQLLDDGYDMVSDPATANDGDGRDPDPEDPGDRGALGGGTFHGTHCAGNIAAATFNATGIVGVAPGAKILPVRVLGRGGGTLDDVVQGVLYAAGLPNASGALPERAADIINLSIAGPGRSQALAEAVAAAREQGAIVIAAAGNFGSVVDDYTPAAEPGVVTVSAVDPDIKLAWYSNYALTPGGIDLTAVGGDSLLDRNADGEPDGVYSTLFRDDGATLYGDIEGTSMAAAQVAGVAALMKAARPELTPEEFDQLIPQMVVDIGEPGQDGEFGHGLLNAPQAVAAALEVAGLPARSRPVLHLSRHGLDFGTLLDELPLAITNSGPGELQVAGVQASDPWVSVEPAAVGHNVVRIDRAAVPLGEQFAVVTVDSNVGAVDVVIRVEREEGEVQGDVGDLMVVLVDDDSGVIVDQTTTRAADGYVFSFDAPGPGRYRVLAGSDWGGLGQLGSAADVLAELPFGGGLVCIGDNADSARCVGAEISLSAPATLAGDRAGYLQVLELD